MSRVLGEELLDLREHRVAVVEPRKVAARLLEVASLRKMVGEVSAVACRRDPVVEALDDARRHVDGGQRAAHVDPADHPDDAKQRAWADRHPLPPREPLSHGDALRDAGGREPFEAVALAPAMRRQVLRCWSEGSPGALSDRPVSRLSNMINRPNDARRR